MRGHMQAPEDRGCRHLDGAPRFHRVVADRISACSSSERMIRQCSIKRVPCRVGSTRWVVRFNRRTPRFASRRAMRLLITAVDMRMSRPAAVRLPRRPPARMAMSSVLGMNIVPKSLKEPSIISKSTKIRSFAMLEADNGMPAAKGVEGCQRCLQPQARFDTFVSKFNAERVRGRGPSRLAKDPMRVYRTWLIRCATAILWSPPCKPSRRTHRARYEEIQADIERGGAMGEPSDRDQVDARRGDGRSCR